MQKTKTMPRKIHKTHDSFVEELRSNKDSAIEFIKRALPEDVHSTFDLEKIEYYTGTYITKELKEYISDIVLKVPLSGTNGEVRVSILIEEKTATDHFTSVELLAYVAHGYAQQEKRNEKPSIIIPVLYNHDKDKCEFDLLGQLFNSLPEEFRMFVPTFQYETVSK